MSAAAAPARVHPQPLRAPGPPRVIRRWPERRLQVACAGPLELRAALAALAGQAGLDAPAKVALGPDGAAELRSEVLRVHGCDAVALAERALRDALDWLDAGMAAPEADPGAPPAPNAPTPEEIEAALERLPAAWSFEAGEVEGRYQVHATALGTSARLQVETRAAATRVSARWAVPGDEPGTGETLGAFALEVNRRLRLARLGIEPAPDATPDARGSVRVTWDATLPFALPLEAALPAAAEAVLGAQAATRRTLRALCQPQVARAYRAARARPGRDASPGTPPDGDRRNA